MEEMDKAFENVRKEINDSLNSLYTAANSLSFADDTTRRLSAGSLEDSVFLPSANESSFFNSSELMTDDIADILECTNSVSNDKANEDGRLTEADDFKYHFNLAGKRFENITGAQNVKQDKIILKPVSKATLSQ